MNKRLTEDELCTAAWEALKDRLGLAQAVRFLSLLRNGGRDYKKWRDEHFKGLTTEQLLEGLRAVDGHSD